MYWLPLILISPYLLLLTRFFRDLLKINKFDCNSAPQTSVSLIIACKNEEKKLPSLLNCLKAQDYPENLLEIIVVDDNSSDNTFGTASGFTFTGKLLVLKNTGNGKKEAIGTGIRASGGELIITTDADCSAGRQWIRTTAAFFEEYRPDLIIGPVRLDSQPGFFGKFQELEFLSLQGITAGTAAGGDAILCNGANLAFPVKSYLDHSHELHNELTTGDDIFLLHSIKREPSSKIMWLESAQTLVTASSARGIFAFLRQRKRWISKWNSYSDRLTIITGIATFMAVMTQLFLTIAVFTDLSFGLPLLAFLMLKSAPDFLILNNTAGRYGMKKLLRWFIPSQIIYPFYVTGVILFSLLTGRERQANYPSRKEI